MLCFSLSCSAVPVPSRIPPPAPCTHAHLPLCIGWHCVEAGGRVGAEDCVDAGGCSSVLSPPWPCCRGGDAHGVLAPHGSSARHGANLLLHQVDVTSWIALRSSGSRRAQSGDGDASPWQLPAVHQPCWRLMGRGGQRCPIDQGPMGAQGGCPSPVLPVPVPAAGLGAAPLHFIEMLAMLCACFGSAGWFGC